MKSLISIVLVSSAILANVASITEDAENVKKSTSENIKHVIVLMLENRSFDHYLGFLKTLNPNIDGCLPNEDDCSNHVDPQNPESETATVDNTAVYVQADPPHSIHRTTQQIYGYPDGQTPPEGAKPTMDGFIQAYTENAGVDGKTIMQCFSPEHVPIMANLSMEYGVFDNWHAAVPGPTMVNRAYAGSATSHGMGTNDEATIIRGLPQKTMFRQLLEMGHDYRVYWQDIPSVLQFKDMRHKDARQRYAHIDQIYSDLQTGDMPAFTWVEPAYFNTERQRATDQHPDHDVTLGEELIKDLYEGIRASPIWENTAFIITYDEHGGFFDHVAPVENVPSPDGLVAEDDPFDFTRLGIRIPTVIVSPWVAKGSVFKNPAPEHQNDEDEYAPSQYEHSSIIATVVHKLFAPLNGAPAPEYLTNRDAWAKTFEDAFNAPQLRTDCPTTLPEVPVSQSHRALFVAGGGDPGSLPRVDGRNPLNDLQKELLAAMAGAVGEPLPSAQELDGWTEAQAGEYGMDRMKLFLSGTETHETH